jgi:CPA1 family monovalent cation:H+ antiporter
LTGESLANDGVAILLFALALVLAGESARNPAGLLLLFLRLCFGGIAVGLITAVPAQAIIRRTPTPISIGLCVVAAYTAYGLGTFLGFSGLLAVIAAGMYISYRTEGGVRPAIFRFWELAGFVVSAVVFLLVGLQVRLDLLWASAVPVLEVWVVILVARGLMVIVFTAPRRHLWPWHWRATLVWAGLRGALSLALALSAPAQIPQKTLLITLAFGFVFVSLALQGLTVGPFFRVIDRRRRMVKSIST